MAAHVVDLEALQKLHSVVRWDKPAPEVIEAAKAAGEDALNQSDPKTGNTTMHIAAQNGHISLVQHLLENKANVNAQNLKGNTPLHMSVEYDMYKMTRLLRIGGAKDNIVNKEGSRAIFGLSNTKVDGDAWDSPLTILKGCPDDPTEIQEALAVLRDALKKGAIIDKGALVGLGLQKKKLLTNWDHTAFQEIVKSI